jgi:thioredoxin-like negative regulator of GroEL
MRAFGRTVVREYLETPLYLRTRQHEEDPQVTTDARPLLVFFTSTRSGPARRMESLLAHLARKERSRLRTAKVDVDERPELAEKFNVDAVPTLVLVKGKRPVARLEGRASAPKIEEMLEPHLPAVPAAPAASPAAVVA